MVIIDRTRFFFFLITMNATNVNFPWFYQLGRAKPNLLVSQTILFIYFGRSSFRFSSTGKGIQGKH